MRVLRVHFLGDLLWNYLRSGPWSMTSEFFGPVDDVNVDGYLHEEGDVLLIELTEITRRNQERTLVVSMDINNAERLHRLVGERLRPKEGERGGTYTGRSDWS